MSEFTGMEQNPPFAESSAIIMSQQICANDLASCLWSRWCCKLDVERVKLTIITTVSIVLFKFTTELCKLHGLMDDRK